MDGSDFGQAAQFSDNVGGGFACDLNHHHRAHLIIIVIIAYPHREAEQGARRQQAVEPVLHCSARYFEHFGEFSEGRATIGAQQGDQFMVEELWSNFIG